MKVDCSHPRANHQHGTRNAYVLDRCRCEPCRAAAAEYERLRTRAIVYGRDGNLVDAEPVREHIRRLSALGMGWKRVAAAAGVAHGTMYPILYGKGGSDPSERRPPRKRVRRDIAERILAVQAELAPGSRVPSTGTVRRLQALVAVGWSISRLARRLDMLPTNLHTLVEDRDQVRRDTADRVAAMYDEIWDQQPPHDRGHDRAAFHRAIRHATARGWVPPAAWDDDAIDDPDATPADTTPDDDVELDQDQDLDEVAIWRRMQGDQVPLTRAETQEVVRRLLAAGMGKNEIERHTGISWYWLKQEAS